MELVTILRVLWDRRIALGVGALAAIAVAVLGGAGVSLGPLGAIAGQQVTAVVSGSVVVDTSDSEIVHVKPKAAETLAMRATLWADLLASEAAVERIARDARIAPDQLAVLGPSTRLEPAVATPLLTRASAAALAVREPNVLRVYSNQELPIVALEASAPDAQRARLLMDAAVEALRSQAAPARTDASPPFVVEPLAAPRTTEILGGSRRRIFALAGGVAVFGLWCGAIVVLAGIARGRRRIAAAA